MRPLGSRSRALLLTAMIAGVLSWSADGPSAGWVSGDVHVHAHGCWANTTPEQLVQLMVGADLEVGSALVWGQQYEASLQSFTGTDDPASLPGHILHFDLEVSDFAAAQVGHPILLGLSQIEFSEDPFRTPGSGVPILDWALDQGPRVLAGMAHGWAWPTDGSFPMPGMWTCCIPFEFPVHVANGTLSFLSDEFGSLSKPVTPATMLLWRLVQNTGFRIALVGASDHPCITNEMGAPRTHVLIDGDLAYEAFLDGIRQGRTVVAASDADWLDLTVAGVRLGGQVDLGPGDLLQAVVDSDLSEAGSLTLLVNGVPQAAKPVGAGPQTTVFPLSVPSSSWVAASSPRAMTGAIYLIVDGQPIRASADDACYLVQYMDHLIDLVGYGLLSFDAMGALGAYQDARDLFEQRFLEAGGTVCPDLPCRLVALEPLLVAEDAGALAWNVPLDVRFVKGDLSLVRHYLTFEEGTLANASSLDISADDPPPGSGLYYLVRQEDCGSWQTTRGAEPFRDQLFP